jgi:hypothetical protein
MPRPLSLLVPGACLALGLGAAISAPPAQAQSEALYTLETTCAVRGGAAQPCVVEALDEGDFTTYRHRIGNITETIRIAETPVRMDRFEASSNSWLSLSSAAARFSTNTICFNGRDLCVVNANYLNSVREESEDDQLQGRDLVMVHFRADGRIDATCFDTGCEVVRR